jgi:alpha-L-fucosidase
MAAKLAMVLALVPLAAGVCAADSAMPIADGPFAPEWESLKQYHCPEWFRDAKFGIWAHWSPQCVPEQGDWYARNMYIQGSSQYNYHVEHYGHPSEFGYKDICHLWTAAKWDPDQLIRLYKRAGARYFVALANHHCNFDCWDSTYHQWNSVNVGPKRDIVGTWAVAARKQGLRFGVTVHSARAWSWFEVSRDSDKTGPKAGVRYDGWLTKADGKGLWWDGLDPQQLYCRPHEPGAPPSWAYVRQWFRRTKDLIDQYHPDVLYFDDHMLPLGDAGLSIAAHYYNAGEQWHNGKIETVLTTKGMPTELRGTLVWDIERGISDRIEPYPWQTDTCIGTWHYLANCRYKSAQTVIGMLADIVSKNGNLLLNIPVRGDGTIDDDEIEFLHDMAAWMDVNSEAIYGTRPWIVFGEGPSPTQGGQFNEGRQRAYTARDIRFTTKQGALYAIALGWRATGRLTVRSLAKLPETQGQVTDVRLLGCRERLEWLHDENGLTVTLPTEKPCEHAYSLKITGKRLTSFRPDLVPTDYATIVSPDADGNLVLDTSTAELHGDGIRFETRTSRENIGFWNGASDWVSWKIKLPEPSTFDVTVECATAAGASEFTLDVAGQQLVAKVPSTGDWDTYTPVSVGKVTIRGPGEYVLSLKPTDAKTWKAINLVEVRLQRAGQP